MVLIFPGKVRTMGSYTLGVISKHSDIDLVCICPQLPNFSYEEGVNTLREFFIKVRGCFIHLIFVDCDPNLHEDFCRTVFYNNYPT